MSYTMDDLLVLMARLRDKEYGCPWDVEQDFKSIAPYTLEEAYEVVDAIDQGDLTHLKEELGDLLLQVIFHSQMATEVQAFNFNEVVDGLVDKLVRRHPHVFPDGTLQSRRQTPELSANEVKGQWDAGKRQERKQKGRGGLLDDVPSALPSLKRAQKLQKRAAKVGFDWADTNQVKEKLYEELEELNHAEREGDATAVQEELGDVLFTAVNLARHLNIDAEEALRCANLKFVQRFEQVEASMNAEGVELSREHVEQMEIFWQRAKTAEKVNS